MIPNLKILQDDCTPEHPDNLIDPTIKDDVMAKLKKESNEFYCDLDAETGEDCDVVDLVINPERYTGYRGELSRRIWRAIYEENCFKTGAQVVKDKVTFWEDAFLLAGKQRSRDQWIVLSLC